MKTILELLEFRAFVHPDRIAVHFEDISIRYKQFNENIDKFSNFLRSKDLNRGDRIAILDFNTLELVYLLYASYKIGIIPIIINWRLTSGEVKKVLEDSNILALFYGKEFELLIKELSFPFLIQSTNSIDIENTEVLKGKQRNLPDAEDIAVQLYTSGTTGLPKGVPLSNKHLLDVVKSLSTELPGFGADTVNLVCAPFFHIGGIGYSLLGHYVGGENVLIKKFDAGLVAQKMQEKKVTNALLVPAMIQAIISLPEIERYDFSTLRNIQFGGSPMPETLLRKAKDIFKCNFTKAYGLTETSGIATLLRYDDIEKGLSKGANDLSKKRLNSVGKSSPGMKILVMKEDMVAPPNQLGEVCIKGDYLFFGYWKKDEINKKSFDKDGWFYTGDIGLMDEDNYLYLFDRKNDMILSKSENIYPIEIEQILYLHSFIQDSAIVGLPDEEYGELITAFVVLKPGKSLTLPELKDFCKEKLASYKIPKRLIIVSEIPRNPSGKILRKELKERFNNINP